ncbi:MAG: hypothetical protein JXD23_06535 [Spirochaetales bacterium]|nr:hypothetical protein [Spirochaetales bacterium]
MKQTLLKKAAMMLIACALPLLSSCDLFPGANAILVTAVVTGIHEPTDYAAALIILSDDGAALSGADVTIDVNDSGFPVSIPESGTAGTYSKKDLSALLTGDTITLRIQIPSSNIDITKSLDLPAMATVSSPNDVDSYSVSLDTPVAWIEAPSLTNPIQVYVPGWDPSHTLQFTQSGADYLETITDSGTTSTTIPADTLVSNHTDILPVNVARMNIQILLGSDFEFGSAFSVGDEDTILITTIP